MPALAPSERQRESGACRAGDEQAEAANRGPSRRWRGACIPPRTDLQIPRSEAVQILAAAYELNPHEVEHDLAIVQLQPWSHLDFLQWLRGRHKWDVSTGLYYLAALDRALHGKPPWF